MTDIVREKYDDIERRQYEASLKEYWDYTSILETAEQKGERKRAKEIARRMKTRGVSLEEIAEMTDLSIEEIKSL
jgi:predicted transposase/invertase (TIGR01784 family)